MSKIKRLIDEAIDAILTRKRIDIEIMECNEAIKRLEEKKKELIESYHYHGRVYEDCLDGLAGGDKSKRDHTEDLILDIITELEEDEKE